MKKLTFWRGAALAMLLVGALQFAMAADVNARIRGVVTDPQGAVLPGIKVTATNDATQVKFDTVTGADGGYFFPQLPVGTYTVSVAATGFKSFTATGIVLNIDQEYSEAIKLTVGSTAEVVEVAASSVQVNTSDMELSNVVNSEQIVELPLINRNFSGLELTQPGVQASSDRFGTYSVAGGQTQQSEFLINGADTNDIALNTLALAPNIDAIDQFNLIDGPLNAEYDRNSGGIVSATLKEGTNHFHGDAFEFYRDTFLNTLNFYQKSVTTGQGVVRRITRTSMAAPWAVPSCATSCSFSSLTRAPTSAFRIRMAAVSRTYTTRRTCKATSRPTTTRPPKAPGRSLCCRRTARTPFQHGVTGRASPFQPRSRFPNATKGTTHPENTRGRKPGPSAPMTSAE